MLKKIKAISLLLSFMMVLGHMMVPHHHHESLAEIKKTHHEHISHAHRHGSHHHHDHEKQESDDKGSSDQNVPQHFHFSTSDNFEPLRIDKAGREINGQAQPTIAIVNLFSWDSNDSYDSVNYPNIWPEKAVRSKHSPEANGLRAPPPIA